MTEGPPCPDSFCDGLMRPSNDFVGWVRWHCTVCGRFFDFVLATTETPAEVPHADGSKPQVLQPDHAEDDLNEGWSES